MVRQHARLGDAIDHGGIIITGATTVLINFLPAARMGDLVYCYFHYLQTISSGDPQILEEFLPAAGVGDSISCGAKIVTGSFDTWLGKAVGIGEPTPKAILLMEGDVSEYFRNPELRAAADLSSLGLATPNKDDGGNITFIRPDDGVEMDFFPKHLPDIRKDYGPEGTGLFPRAANEQDFEEMS
jgi:uncharacterized Zn-binding protein involved in type VI secretion